MERSEGQFRTGEASCKNRFAVTLDGYFWMLRPTQKSANKSRLPRRPEGLLAVTAPLSSRGSKATTCARVAGHGDLPVFVLYFLLFTLVGRAWKHYPYNHAETLVCFQSANNQRLKLIDISRLEFPHRRIDGTFHLFNTFHTVPSILPVSNQGKINRVSC